MINQYVLPLNQIDNLRPVAEDLSGLLMLSSNADITKEFPQTVKHLSNPECAARNLAKTRERFAEGKREDFVLFAGKRAVGMSQIATPGYSFGVDPECPIFSNFVDYDHRRQGIGRLSIDICLEAVNQRFNGRAMTIVKHKNVASIGLVLSSGFVLTGSSVNAGTYTYGNQY